MPSSGQRSWSVACSRSCTLWRCCRFRSQADSTKLVQRSASRGMSCFRSIRSFVALGQWLFGWAPTRHVQPTSGPIPWRQLAGCPGCTRAQRRRERSGERWCRAGRASRGSRGILKTSLVSFRSFGRQMRNLRDSRMAPQHPKKAMTNTRAPRAMRAAGKKPGWSPSSKTCCTSPTFLSAMPPTAIKAIPPIYNKRMSHKASECKLRINKFNQCRPGKITRHGAFSE